MEEVKMINYIQAHKLREKENLNKIPNDKPGYYKWWATKKSLQIILDKLDISFQAIENFLEERDGLFCIYVGVAIKESLRNRLNWHINQVNNISNVKNGTLSTLRQTISSIVGANMLDTTATNNFIDTLYVEYHLINLPIKSQEARDKIHKIEADLLNCNTLYILNIQDNHHKLSPRRKLTELRKTARQV